MTKIMPPERKRAVKTSHIAFAELISTLLAVPQSSIAELADASGLHKLTVGFIMRTLRTRHAAYIGGYGTDSRGRHNIPLWSLGNKKDAPRPPRADRNAVRRRAREWKARQRMAEQLNLFKPAPQLEPLTKIEHETV